MKRISCAVMLTMIAIVLPYTGSAVAQTFSKTANPSSGAAPLTVIYTYTFDNSQGPRRLDSVDTPVDDTCSPVVSQGGDSNQNHMLDVGEIWTWTCTAVINATTLNTAHATVSIMPAPLTVSIGGKRSVCKNELVNLTAVAAGGTPPYTFAWTNGATSQAITPNTSVAGTFPFGVTVTDHAGKTASANAMLTVASICLTEIKPLKTPPDFPLLTTIQWGCGWNFAGRCLSQTIVQICIGGQCFDTPGGMGPPI